MVAPLVEWLLPTPEICGSNPNIGKVLSTNWKLNRKDKNKEKEAGNGSSAKKCNNHSKFTEGTSNDTLQDVCLASKENKNPFQQLPQNLSFLRRGTTLRDRPRPRHAFPPPLQPPATRWPTWTGVFRRRSSSGSESKVASAEIFGPWTKKVSAGMARSTSKWSNSGKTGVSSWRGHLVINKW